VWQLKKTECKKLKVSDISEKKNSTFFLPWIRCTRMGIGKGTCYGSVESFDKKQLKSKEFKICERNRSFNMM
jgi:hypothetical protein